MEEKPKTREKVLKGLFILGVVLIIFILTYATFKVLPKIYSSFATVGSVITSPFTGQNLGLDTDNGNLNSGETTTIFWDYTTDDPGTFDIRYTCQEGVDVSIKLENEDPKKLLCNMPYRLNSAISSIEIIPMLAEDKGDIELPIDVRFVDERGYILIDDSISLIVRNNADGELTQSRGIIESEPLDDETVEEVVQEDEPEVQSNYITQSSPTTFRGVPDLFISNGHESSDSVISFTVQNIGSASTGRWFFSYIMPDGTLEYSPAQPSLSRGQGLRYTLALNNVPDGVVQLRVDPFSSVSESNEANNIIAVAISGRGTTGGGDINYDSDDDADLDIRDLDVGRLSGSRFIKDSTIDENDEAAVRFEVINRGGESTGSWRFEISNLPYDSNDDYRSNRQTSLRPGEVREIIVGFDNPDDGNYRIKVEVDSDDDVDEENERNNDETERLEVDRD